MTQPIQKIVAWLLAAAVTLATLGPPGLRPHLAVGQAGEHALAFALVGLSFGIAYPKHRWTIAAVSVVMIGILELLQLLVPGRHARLGDFVVDAVAALIGFTLSAILDRLQRSGPSTPESKSDTSDATAPK